jgi:hypothetical protein
MRSFRLVIVVATTTVVMMVTAAPAMASDDCGWIWGIWSGWGLVCE